MSRRIENIPVDFELGDSVSFIGPNGVRLFGTVVRVYNTRDLYHVDVYGARYEVDRNSDRMEPA